ncbi:MAG TPA: hypothetical protein VFX49_15005 [Chloroflexota bacterium]|nr:hypothetical protein [Chloroflexota bacterium]
MPIAALCAAACVVVFQVPLLGKLPGHYDFWLQEFVHLAVLRRALRGGELPLWDPFLAGGTPHLADPQTAVLYPFTTLPVLLAPPELVERVSIPAHFALAGVGTFLLCRDLTLTRAASLAGGLVYMLAPHFAPIELPTYLQQSGAWAPWVLWALGRAFDRFSAAWAALAAALWALQLYRGYPQTSYFTAVAAAAYAAQRIVFLRGSGRLRGVSLVALFAAGALALSAAQLLPTLDLLRESHRADSFGLAEAAGRGRVTLFNLLGIAGPDAEVSGAFPGGIALSLACIGLLGNRVRPMWFFVGLGVTALLLCLGSATPLWGMAHAVMPGFRLWHMPHRTLFLWTLSLAVVAAGGLNALGVRRMRSAALVAPIAVVGVMALVGLVMPGAPDGAQSGALHLISGVLVLCTGVWLRRTRAGPAVPPLLALFAGLDLLAHSLPRLHGRFFPPDAVFAPPPAAQWLMARADSPAGVRFVSATHGPLADGLGDPLAQDNRRLAYLPPNSSAVFDGLDAFQGYLAIRLTRSGEVFNSINDVGARSRLLSVYDLGSPLLDDLGVRYVITNDIESFPTPAGRGLAPSAPGQPSELQLASRFRLAFRSHGVRIWENLRAAPFAGLEPAADASSVIVERRSFNAVDLRVRSASAATLVVGQTLAPGWRASVDGAGAEIGGTELGQMQLVLPAGEHTVRLRYLPTSVLAGGGITAAAVLAATVAVVVTRRRAPPGSRTVAAPDLPNDD